MAPGKIAALVAFAMCATPAFGQTTIDLTDVVLSSRNADCGSYEGRYTSHITDAQTGRKFEGAVQISAVTDNCVFRSNQIPNHDTGEGNPKWGDKLAETNLVLTIPRNPQKADSTTALDFSSNAILLNGIKWDAFPAACFGVGNEKIGLEKIGCGPDQYDNPWRYEVGSPLNTFQFDNYYAHLQPGGLYHYHKMPLVLYETDCSTGPSPVIGFARDGFPVYGPCIKTSDGTATMAKSSYVLREGKRQAVAGYETPYVVGNVKSDSYDGQFFGDYMYVAGSGDLDECNGAEVDGQYGYYLTAGYPYVTACKYGKQ